MRSPLEEPAAARSDFSTADDPGDRLRVSVVAPMRDMGDQARTLISALGRQTLAQEQFELILADDGSALDSIHGLADLDRRVRVLPGAQSNSYAARNRGVAAARGSVLAFCDADCRPEPEWLDRGIAALANADIVGGLIRFVLPDRLSIWGLLDIDTFLDQESAVKSGFGLGGNLFLRRELFDRIGGFDDTQPNHGDYDFVARCVASGARLIYARDAVVWHPTRNSARPYLRKLWAVNEKYSERETRAGRKPEGLKLRSWVPVVQTLRGRRRVGRTIGLDRRRLAENGLRPRPWDDVRALPIIYFLVPYLRGIAQLRGWLVGRKHRGEAPPLKRGQTVHDQAT